MTAPLDVLVVGAGPTRLALAAQLRSHGAAFRILDRSLDRARESRALAFQPRTLEALAGSGVTGELVARGNPAMQLRMHLPRRVVQVPLFDIGLADTAYPFLLFLSQAETEHRGEAFVGPECGRSGQEQMPARSRTARLEPARQVGQSASGSRPLPRRP